MDDILSTPASVSVTATRKRTPWGLFVGLLLILIVIVASALYVFEQRISAPAGPATTTSAT